MKLPQNVLYQGPHFLEAGPVRERICLLESARQRIVELVHRLPEILALRLCVKVGDFENPLEVGRAAHQEKPAGENNGDKFFHSNHLRGGSIIPMERLCQ